MVSIARTSETIKWEENTKIVRVYAFFVGKVPIACIPLCSCFIVVSDRLKEEKNRLYNNRAELFSLSLRTDCLKWKKKHWKIHSDFELKKKKEKNCVKQQFVIRFSNEWQKDLSLRSAQVTYGIWVINNNEIHSFRSKWPIVNATFN